MNDLHCDKEVKANRIINPISSFIKLFKSESKFKIYNKRNQIKVKIKTKKYLIKMKNHLHKVDDLNQDYAF